MCGFEQIVDTIVVDGPRQTEYTDTDSSPVDKVVQWALPKCGAGTIKYRTELKIEALKEGAEGTAASEGHETDDGGFDYYGAQQGVSYDFEKCAA